MNVNDGQCTIKFTHSELWGMANDTHRALAESIKTHYNSLQHNEDGEPIFLKQEKEKLDRMKMFFSLTGRIDMYEMYFEDYKKMFAEKRKEREQVRAK